MIRCRVPSGVAFLFLCLASGLHGQESFTLDQVLSAPFPTALTAGSQGDRVAWVQDRRGVRNVWAAEAPEYVGRQVTAYVADDGQEIGNLQFVFCGTALIYVRGGSPNGAGELPNPRSDPAGVTRAIWRIPVDGGDPLRLADGAGPVVSPDGETVAYLRGGIRAIPAGGGESRRLVNGRGGEGSLTWSPDGCRIAFVSGRGDHSFAARTGSTLLVTSNRGDIDRRHLWEVPLESEGARLGSHRGGGVEWSPAAPEGGADRLPGFVGNRARPSLHGYRNPAPASGSHRASHRIRRLSRGGVFE